MTSSFFSILNTLGNKHQDITPGMQNLTDTPQEQLTQAENINQLVINSSIVMFRVVGYCLLVLVAGNWLVLALPPDFQSPVWKFETMQGNCI